MNVWNGYVTKGEGYAGTFIDGGHAWATAGNSDYTTSDLVATNSTISAGAYSAKISYREVGGSTYSFAGYTTLGQIVPFSSHGPTADGRVKPDITAPGLSVVSALSSWDNSYKPLGSNYSSVVSIYQDPNSGNNYSYGALSGTSMASPCTSGIIALLLEADPTLTPAQIRAILAQTAILDSFTGALPVQGLNTWGHGKINAYAAVKSAIIASGIGNVPGGAIDCMLYPNPNTGKFAIEYTGTKDEALSIEIYDLMGSQVYAENWKVNAADTVKSMDLSALSAGMYVAKISSAKGSAMIKVAIEK